MKLPRIDTSKGDETVTTEHRAAARRRVVTGRKGGKSVVLSDTPAGGSLL